MSSRTHVTLEDIASSAEVSIATASRALRPGDTGVQLKTRERILKIAQERGYPVPLALQATRRLIALYLPPRFNEWAPHIYLSGITQSLWVALREDQRHSLALIGDEEVADGRLAGLKPELDGLFIVRSGPRTAEGGVQMTRQDDREGTEPISLPLSQIEQRLLEFRLPTVFLGSVPLNELSQYRHATLVDLDNYGNGREAVLHLSRLGHTRIAHIAGPVGHPVAGERERGFRDMVRQLGLDVPSAYIVRAADWYEASGNQAMEKLLAQPGLPLPTAVFCANDQLALGAQQAIEAHGMTVPADMSLIGHDNLRVAHDIGLTTFDHEIPSFGAEALDLLIRLQEKLRDGEELIGRRDKAAHEGENGSAGGEANRVFLVRPRTLQTYFIRGRTTTAPKTTQLESSDSAQQVADPDEGSKRDG